MAKSSINLLQELSIKQGYMPKYDFIEKRINETSIQFICYVSGEQLKACGTGSSKKEAKHNAANNMLLLLDINNKIPLPDTLSSSSANVTQSPAEICEMSPLCKQSIIDRNYIGLLQEFYQQQKVSTKDIVYKVVCEEGSSHLKMFTIEVSVGPLRERATGYNKKLAKQEAAKKLLLRLNPAIVNTNAVPNAADSNMVLKTVDLNGINSNRTNILQDINKLDICEKTTLENNIKKLGTEIVDYDSNKETLAELSEKAKVRYLECKTSDKSYKKVDQEVNPSVVQNLHILFERNYSSKFPCNLRERMYRIVQDNYTDQMDLRQIKQDIESSLRVRLQQIIICSKTKNHILCLRLLSNPCITQFGMGDTRFIAESHATYNLIKAILIFLNVSEGF